MSYKTQGHTAHNNCHNGWDDCLLCKLGFHVMHILFHDSELFLIFAQGLPLMSDCMEFGDYLEAGVHLAVRENTSATDWAEAKVRINKSLRQLGDNKSTWPEGFAGAVGFNGSEDQLVDCIIGYTMTEKVTLNVGYGNFERVSQKPNVNPTVTYPALLSPLQGQANLIQSLIEKVNRPSEAPEKPEDKIPPLSLKELHKLSGVWNHPQWVMRTIYFLKCAILKEPLPVKKMQMTHQWNHESQKPLLFALSEDQRKDEAIWTETTAATGDTPMGGDPSTPPRPLEMNAAAIQMVEALWMLTYSSVYCYKNRYETDLTSPKQASSNPDFTSSPTPTGARLKKVMKKRVVDGVEFFEVHHGEWVRSHSSPVGPL